MLYLMSFVTIASTVKLMNHAISFIFVTIVSQQKLMDHAISHIFRRNSIPTKVNGPCYILYTIVSQPKLMDHVYTIVSQPKLMDHAISYIFRHNNIPTKVFVMMIIMIVKLYRIYISTDAGMTYKYQITVWTRKGRIIALVFLFWV